jgi:hypothetical protein
MAERRSLWQREFRIKSVEKEKPLKKVEFTTEQLTGRWEDRRSIKNLMGKYVNCIVLNRDQKIFDMFWSKRQDICLGFNDGYYIGPEAVRSYYNACFEKNVIIARLLQDKYPDRIGDKTHEEIIGIGTFKFMPLSTPLIELSQDGETAKAMFHSQGACAEVGTSGPITYWTWAYLAADLIRDDKDWRIWHLLYVEDVKHPCGQSWGKEPVPFPEYPEFEALSDFKKPEFTKKIKVRERYSPSRPFTHTPRIPEPYDSFKNTFSYGILGGK